MRKNVITVSPDTTIKQLKEIMKTNRISGVPVLDGGRLIGVASIEDLIKALEAGELDVPVSQRMTRQLITVMEKESIVEAIKKFSQFHVGRLLVVNEQGDLTGILTGSDITRGLLEAISLNDDDEEAKRKPRINYQGRYCLRLYQSDSQVSYQREGFQERGECLQQDQTGHGATGDTPSNTATGGHLRL